VVSSLLLVLFGWTLLNISNMTEVDKHKHKLADTLAPLISIEGLTDVTDWIEKNGGSVGDIGCTHNGVARSVAYILEATGEFQREQLEDKSRYFVKKLPKKSFEQRKPTLFKAIFYLLGVASTLGGVLLQNHLSNQSDKVIYKVQDYRTDALYDSVKNIRHDLKTVQDTLASHK
jgi:hypothetical protein